MREQQQGPGLLDDEDLLGTLVDVFARGVMAAHALAPRVPADDAALALVRAEAERARRIQVLALADPGCRRAETIPALIGELDGLVTATMALPVPPELAILACHGLGDGLEVGALPLATAELPPERVIALLQALIAALSRVLAELPPAERARLAGIIASLEGLLAMLRAGGVRLTLPMLQAYLEPLLLRLLQLCGRLPPSLVRLLWGPAVAFLDGLGAAGVATAPLLTKLLVAAAGLAIGVLIGLLILKIPVGGGRTVWNVVEDSFLTDVFWWLWRKAGGIDDCETKYATYLRARQIRRTAESQGADAASVAAAIAAEIQTLGDFIPCLPEHHRGTFERELARLRARLGQ
jgi:hypothetical protein